MDDSAKKSDVRVIMRHYLGLLVCGTILAGCAAAPRTAPVSAVPSAATATAAASPNHGVLLPYPDTDKFQQCVPFARAVSGIPIYGDAWTWWDQARGKHPTGHHPVVGSVLVFKRSDRLKLGHLSVVAQVNDSRSILVTHANWGDNNQTRGVVHERQPIIDVSPNNDWSEVRLTNIQGTKGRTYPAHGFIYRPAEGVRVAQN